MASPAVADIPSGVPDALSPDPVMRGALIAMPAVWNVRVTAHMTGLRLKNGDVVALPREARTVQKEGTAFAVTPDGFLLSALHVATPPPAEIAATAYLEKMAITGQPHSAKIAADWVKRTGARPVGLKPLERVVRASAAGPGLARDTSASPRVVTTDKLRDLVVLRVPGTTDAPSIALDRGEDVGTPVANLGFGSSDPFAAPQHGALVPSVRTGTIAETGHPEKQPTRYLTIITNPIQLGDSGGPVVDERGRARGLVLIKRKVGGGAMAPTDELLRVLDEAGVRPWEGRTQTLYRSAIGKLQRYDIAGARADLRRTLASDPNHGLAGYELQQADALATARVALAGEPRYRSSLLVIGITALLVAGLLAVLLWKAVNRMPGVLGPRDRKAPFDQDHPDDPGHDDPYDRI
jgi:S1-C subfamily serine protease